MVSYDLQYRIELMQKELTQLKTEIIELKGNSNEAWWDNNDMMRNWKVSLRTLATWRAEGLIDFVQSGSKIWYTKENRDTFIQRNSVNAGNKIPAELM